MELKNKFYKNLHIFVPVYTNRCSEIGRPVYLALKGKLQAGHWIINSLEHVPKNIEMYCGCGEIGRHARFRI